MKLEFIKEDDKIICNNAKDGITVVWKNEYELMSIDNVLGEEIDLCYQDFESSGFDTVEEMLTKEVKLYTLIAKYVRGQIFLNDFVGYNFPIEVLEMVDELPLELFNGIKIGWECEEEKYKQYQDIKEFKGLQLFGFFIKKRYSLDIYMDLHFCDNELFVDCWYGRHGNEICSGDLCEYYGNDGINIFEEDYNASSLFKIVDNVTYAQLQKEFIEFTKNLVYSMNNL